MERDAGNHKETGRAGRWSILDGEFIPNDDFPNLDEIKLIKGTSAHHPDENIQRRVFYTELLVYALRYVNPALVNISIPERVIIKTLIDEMADAMYQLDTMHRQQDIKQISEAMINQPMGQAGEIPIMQALRKMQEIGAIDYDTRIILDAVVRAVHIKQSSGRSVK